MFIRIKWYLTHLLPACVCHLEVKSRRVRARTISLDKLGRIAEGTLPLFLTYSKDVVRFFLHELEKVCKVLYEPTIL
jgi:hypothetical protein